MTEKDINMASWMLLIFAVLLFIAAWKGVIIGALIGMIVGLMAGPLGSLIGLIVLASAQYYIMHH